jgi:hypothetical protein
VDGGRPGLDVVGPAEWWELVDVPPLLGTDVLAPPPFGGEVDAPPLLAADVDAPPLLDVAEDAELVPVDEPLGVAELETPLPEVGLTFVA